MKNMKKIIAVLLVLAALASLFTACSTKPAESSTTAANPSEPSAAATDPAKETLEPVTLKMYLLGDKPAGFDEVYAKINEKLSQDIQTTLDVEFISWSDVDQKYSLLFASGEDFDLIFTAPWAYYSSVANKNGFLEITEDMMKQYAPNTWDEVPEAAWEQAKINGKVYMIPCTTKEYSTRLMVIRGDLRKKYDVPEVTSLEGFQNYLYAVAENEPGIIPMQLGDPYMLRELVVGTFNGWDYLGNVGNNTYLMYDYNSDSNEIFSMLDMPEYLDYLNMMHDWKERGVWTKDVLSDQSAGQGMAQGREAVSIQNIGIAGLLNSVPKEHPDYDPELIDLSVGKTKMPALYINNGMAIHATSKNPERALMVLDLFRNNREYYDLTWYGIEGKHYTAIGDTGYSSLPDSADYGAGGACQWGWGVSSMQRTADDEPEQRTEIMDRWINEETVNHPLQNFNFDDTNVKNEMANIANVYQQYALPLELGFVDVEDGLATLKEKLDQAGIEKVRQEMQTQLDEYLKNLK